MTPKRCRDWAFNKGYNWYGMQSAKDCYGGYTLPSDVIWAPGECTSVCSGQPDFACGGPNRVSLYQSE